MSDEKAQMERNIVKFLETHGQEGFFKLFLTNYLYDLVMYYVHSSGRGRQENPGYYLYFSTDDRVYSAEEVDGLREAVKKECARKADFIVSEMKRQEILQEAITSPIEISSPLFNLVQNAIKGMLKRG